MESQEKQWEHPKPCIDFETENTHCVQSVQHMYAEASFNWIMRLLGPCRSGRGSWNSRRYRHKGNISLKSVVVAAAKNQNSFAMF